MRFLELKLPPPAVALAFAALMAAAAHLTSPLEVEVAVRAGAATVLLVAAAVTGLSAIAGFRGARTTVDPTRPAKASALVTSGVYRATRNPMYLALTLGLCAWGTWLASPWAALGPLGLVLYLTRFQIGPEERVLREKFGQDYADYCARTRRWL
ncbi:MAG: isoprenylcysteine carboxylmethyltransferase family protein [Myxococcaceae bacterium]|nr:isoprenylcysteine carboxylmethyltransferase family protein [Myxococcaceae bacterium]